MSRGKVALKKKKRSIMRVLLVFLLPSRNSNFGKDAPLAMSQLTNLVCLEEVVGDEDESMTEKGHDRRE
jgi:hypothetical protein